MNLVKAYKNFIEEYKKIFWPKRADVIEVTIVVLILTFIVAMLVLGFDYFFNFSMSRLTNLMHLF